MKNLGHGFAYFEEEMVCLNCGNNFKYKHGLNDKFRCLANKCDRCKSTNVVTKESNEYFEKHLYPYLLQRIGEITNEEND